MVAPGPGTVIRFGNVAAWADASASGALVGFLAESARNLSASPVAGSLFVEHLSSILHQRDPEPGVAFVVCGPSATGWVALVHGPAQAWDGSLWYTATPTPGWTSGEVKPRPSLTVNALGQAPPVVPPDAGWGLEAGVVPGSGFVMFPLAAEGPIDTNLAAATTLSAPPSRAASAGAAEAQTRSQQGPPRSGNAEPGTSQAFESASTAAPVGPEAIRGPGTVLAETLGAGTLTPEPLAGRGAVDAMAHATGSVGSEPSADLGSPGSPNPVMAGAGPFPVGRQQAAARPPRPLPPLPPVGAIEPPVPGSPVVAGVLCASGHLNRPGMTACARCRKPIPASSSPLSGARPPLGCLVFDDGSIYRLARPYLVGSDPESDPTVRGGLAVGLKLEGSDLSPSHAEIKLDDWEVVVIDRSSKGQTSIWPPGSVAWVPLTPFRPTALKPATHLAFGSRVATFLTPWLLERPYGV